MFLSTVYPWGNHVAATACYVPHGLVDPVTSQLPRSSISSSSCSAALLLSGRISLVKILNFSIYPHLHFFTSDDFLGSRQVMLRSNATLAFAKYRSLPTAYTAHNCHGTRPLLDISRLPPTGFFNCRSSLITSGM